MTTSNLKPFSRRLFALAASSLLTFGGAWLLFLPFHLHFVALFSQIAIVRDPTDLIQFLSHLGGPSIVASLGLVVLLLPRGREHAPGIRWLPGVFALGLAALGIAALSIEQGALAQTAGALLVIAALSVPPLVAAWTLTTRGEGNLAHPVRRPGHPDLGCARRGERAHAAVFGLLFALGTAAAVGWLRLDRRIDRFVCLLAAAGLLTAAGTEIVVVADDLIDTAAYRMNTVFKFYNQVWVLLSLAGAALFALMIREVRQTLRTRVTISGLPTIRPVWARSGVSVTLLVFLASLTYPALATGPRLEQRFTPGTPVGTLDAFAWMEAGTVPVLGSPAYDEIAYAGDADAIAWFFANVSGSPVVAEASIGPYRCNGSRISAATGLPTIIGWERHQQQQRYPETLPARGGREIALYLARYRREGIHPAPLQRGVRRRRGSGADLPHRRQRVHAVGSEAGIEAFDAMVGTTLEVAHASSGTTIYRVLPVRPA